MNMTIPTNSYRFAWQFKGSSEIHYGTFLFNEPAEAVDTYGVMQKMFPSAAIWLEDDDHNRVEIPK